MSVSTESLQDRRSMLSANALRTPAVSQSGSLAELSVVGASPAAHAQIRNPRRFKSILRTEMLQPANLFQDWQAIFAWRG